MTLRKKVRIFTDDRRVEGFTIAVVLIYFAFIIVDILVPELVFSFGYNSKVIQEYKDFTIFWMRAFWMIDLLFLSFFLVEIAVRVYAWGMTYVRDLLNMIDFAVVLVSFVMLWVTLPYTMSGGTDSGLGTALALLRVFRGVRFLRLVVILNKINRTREDASRMRQKAKYKREGSPVERVVDILQGLKRKSDSNAERENLGFMMDVIVSGNGTVTPTLTLPTQTLIHVYGALQATSTPSRWAARPTARASRARATQASCATVAPRSTYPKRTWAARSRVSGAASAGGGSRTTTARRRW